MKKKAAMLCMMVMTAVFSLTACGGMDNGVEEAETLTGEPLPSAGENGSSGETEEPGENASSGTAEAAGEDRASETGKDPLSAEKPDGALPESSAESSSEDPKDEAAGSTTDKNNLKSILLGERNFICTDLAGKNLNIEEIAQAVTDDDSITVSAEKFAVIDLDGDGEEEAVLWLMINHVSDYGFEVLYAQDGEIYGYTLPYREFMNLKTDGTFLFSGGAADAGIGKMIFSGMEYSIEELACSSSEYNAENELTMQYFMNDRPCSADEFDAAVSSQEQKTDVKWYALSKENIEAVF